MPIIPEQRHLFDIPDDVAYFNCAGNSPQLNESRRRLVAGAHGKSHPWVRTAKDFFDDAETVRRLCVEIFGGDADGYAVAPSASHGLSTAARAIETHLGVGDKILVIAEDFPSVVLPWRRATQETGATILTVPAPADEDWTRAILDRHDTTVRSLQYQAATGPTGHT